jgi:tRNA(Arg) A34 adenosine deaminase TadA
MDSKQKFLKRTIELAQESVDKCGFPAGALIVKDNEIISEGISIGSILHDPTSHAETAAIRNACKILKTTNLEGTTLYESIQCCLMCLSVAYWAGIEKIIYIASKKQEYVDKGYYEGTIDNNIINEQFNRKIIIEQDNSLESEVKELIEKWENSN